jgi:hypothetical protein
VISGLALRGKIAALNPRSRSAFATTESDDSAIAAVAIIGLSSSPIAA